MENDTILTCPYCKTHMAFTGSLSTQKITCPHPECKNTFLIKDNTETNLELKRIQVLGRNILICFSFMALGFASGYHYSYTGGTPAGAGVIASGSAIIARLFLWFLAVAIPLYLLILFSNLIGEGVRLAFDSYREKLKNSKHNHDNNRLN